MKKLFIGCITVITVLMGLAGCNSERTTYEGPNYLMFSDTLYRYAVQETGEVFNVPVSATVLADYDRTFAVEVVDSISDAVEGKHYRLLSNTVTIKAGECSANVQVQGIYDNIDIDDYLTVGLRLVIPKEEQWSLYGIDSKVVLQKACSFDINSFTGYCKVTSTFFDDYMQTVTMRLIKTSVNPEEENSVILHDLYYNGHDIVLDFDRDNLLEPLVSMEEQVCGTTAEAFGTIYGDGNLLMYQPTMYTSYYSTCEKFVLQYVTLHVDGVGTVGTYVNILEWISDAEAEKLKEQGY